MLTAHGAFLAKIDNFVQDFFPVVHLRSQDRIRSNDALVQVRRHPVRVRFSRHRFDRSDSLLRRTGQEVGAGVHVGFGDFTGLHDLVERTGISDPGFYIPASGGNAHLESLVVFDRVAGFHRSDDPDDLGFGHFTSEKAHDIGAFLGLRIIGDNIRSGLEAGAVGERDLGEFRGDFFHDALVLRAVGNDDVKPLGCILTDSGAGIHRFAHPLTDG